MKFSRELDQTASYLDYKKKLLQVSGILFLVIVTLFFRTHALRGPSSSELQIIREKAEQIVDGLIRSQAEIEVAQAYPGIVAEGVQELVDQRIQQTKVQDKGMYQKHVLGAIKKLRSVRDARYNPDYLSGGDSYYYLSLVESIARKGSLGEPGSKRTFLNRKRLAPQGHWDAFSLHPVLGFGLYQVLSKFNPEIKITHAVSFYPLVLSLVLMFCFYGLCKTLRVHEATAFFATLAFVLSPIVIQRTNLGWFDTDPYQLLFPILILWTYFRCLHHQRMRAGHGIVGGLLTAFYSFFWVGWSYILFLMVGALLVCMIYGWKHKRIITQYEPALYFIGYLPTTMIAAFIFLTPEGFVNRIDASLRFIPNLAGKMTDYWPSLFAMIEETATVGFLQWYYLISDKVFFVVGVIGLLSGFLMNRKKEESKFLAWLAVFVMAMPLLFLSFRAERSVLLFTLPFSLMVIFGLESIQTFLVNRLRFHRWQKLASLSVPAQRVLVFCLLLILIIPSSLSAASRTAKFWHRVMNDTWHQVLTSAEEETPKNAIIVSGWDAGYFIQSVANRKSILDGGTQRHQENYWFAKLMMAQDENYARGIIRFLLGDSDGALEFLESKRFAAADSTALIDRLVSLQKTKAKKLLPSLWTDEEKDEFLTMTHPSKDHLPAYVLVYDDLVDHHVLLQLMSQWDFKKAEQIMTQPQEESGGNDKTARYGKLLTQVSGKALPALEPATMAHKRGNQYVFQNGLIIEGDTNKAFTVNASEGKVDARALTLHYRDREGWDVSLGDGEQPLSAIWLPESKGGKAVVAHRDLLKTLLFELFYFEASRLEYFKPAILLDEPVSGHSVGLYEVLWEDF